MKRRSAVQTMDRVFKPEFDRSEIPEFAQAAFQPPSGRSLVGDHVPDVLAELQFDHVQLGVRITGEHAAA